MKDEDLISLAHEEFDRCVETESDNRAEGLDDLRFSRLAEQWPEAIKRQRLKERRPCLTINRMPAFIRQVVNDARQNKPSIKVHPVDDSADPDTAEILNGLIRNIEASSNADVAYDTAFESAVNIGWGYFRVNTAYTSDDTFDQDIVIERIADPFSVYGDPYSTAADSSDWDVAFVTETMSRKAFERRFKGAQPVDWDGVYQQCAAPWVDGDRVMVAEWWKREEVKRQIVGLADGQVVDLEAYQNDTEGKFLDPLTGQPIPVVGEPREVRSHKVTMRIISGAEVLETVEWAGKYIPIIPVYGDEVNVEGRRYFRSLIRDAKDPARMHNYWRTAATELVALAPKAPFIGPEGAFVTDADKWASANTESHAYIEYDGPVAPQRQPFAGVPAGALQEALNASDDMKAVMGLYDASLGARSNETSGRAIMARQREGDVSTFHFIDNLSRAIRHAGRILIDLIPKVYSTERVVRILSAEGLPTTVPVNQPFEVPGQPQQPNQPPPPPQVKIYDLRAGKYDLVVNAGPSFTSRREEAATQMMELIRAYPAAAEVVGDIMARNLDWPGADEIADRLKALFEQKFGGGEQQQAPQQPPMDPAKMISAQTQQFKAQSDAQIAQQKNQIDAFEAETARMKAVHELQQPTRLPRMPDFPG